MNNNFKIVLKIIIVIVILLNLPFQKVFSENIENVAASLSATDVQKQQNGKSIYIYNTHQGEEYASQSVKEGSRYLMQLLQNKGCLLYTSLFRNYKESFRIIKTISS